MATQTQLCPSRDSAQAGAMQGVIDGFLWALDAVTSAACDFSCCHHSELAVSKSEHKPPFVPNLPASVNVKIYCHSWLEYCGLTHTCVSIYFFKSLHPTSISDDTSEMGKTSYRWRAKCGTEPHCQHTHIVCADTYLVPPINLGN